MSGDIWRRNLGVKKSLESLMEFKMLVEKHKQMFNLEKTLSSVRSKCSSWLFKVCLLLIYVPQTLSCHWFEQALYACMLEYCSMRTGPVMSYSKSERLNRRALRKGISMFSHFSLRVLLFCSYKEQLQARSKSIKGLLTVSRKMYSCANLRETPVYLYKE